MMVGPGPSVSAQLSCVYYPPCHRYTLPPLPPLTAAGPGDGAPAAHARRGAGAGRMSCHCLLLVCCSCVARVPVCLPVGPAITLHWVPCHPALYRQLVAGPSLRLSKHLKGFTTLAAAKLTAAAELGLQQYERRVAEHRELIEALNVVCVAVMRPQWSAMECGVCVGLECKYLVVLSERGAVFCCGGSQPLTGAGPRDNSGHVHAVDRPVSGGEGQSRPHHDPPSPPSLPRPREALTRRPWPTSASSLAPC